ncbi:hypothetical protein TrLO_g1339 [Triparma laevis f. longispina]|uniref:U3 small nucleolar RNA-associated protein 14 n=1 Tax=Triparma laevis f. longispina TaxID=1714387 RepID=A0A9W7FNX8_9STRA|nr:hypothetical protein TrLO_g1339 [Triparma laevis f. longispina]
MARSKSKPATDFSKIKTADEYNQEYLNQSGEDESEIDSDDAFDSDDEKKYGSLFANNDDSESDEEQSDSDGSSNSSDESDDSSEEVDMLAALDNMPSNSSSSTRKSLSTSHASIPESRFSATASSSTLTMDALLNPMSNTEDFATLRNTTSKIVNTKSASTRLSDVVLDRAKRKVVYKDVKSDISNWTDSVKMNREAETLDFRPKGREVVTTNSLSNTFTAENDFEKKIEEALMKQKVLEKDDEDDFSDDDLGHNNNLTLEEVKKRHAELSKIRSLLFYEESKRHRLNKIKSKKYRKIRKKKSDREKLKEMELMKELDPSAAREEEEKEAVKRMEERMTLQHRNTSKWARKQLRRGNLDTDTRRQLSEQIAIGDKLRKKMSGEDEEESDSDEEDLKKVAEEVLRDEGGGEEEGRSSLFKLDFMKKGVEGQRRRAKEEAAKILREIEEEEEWKRREEGGESEGESDDDEEEEEEEKEERVGREEAKRILEGRVEKETRVGEGITIDISDSEDEDKVDNVDDKVVHIKNVKPAATSKKAQKETKKTKKTQKTQKKETKEGFDTDNNPWMQQKQPKKGAKGGKKIADASVVDVEAGVKLMVDKTKVDVTGDFDDSDDDSENCDVTTLTQKQLVKRAFAGAKDAREDFEREKKLLKQKEEEKKEEDNEVKGWGSWTGVGVKPPSKKKKQRGKLAAPKKEEKKREREDAKLPTVILNEKRHKKSSQFKVAVIPYPYTSAEQYERAMAGPVGSDWQTTKAVQEGTRQEIITRNGRIIDPAGKRMKRKQQEEKGGRRKFRA